MRLLVEAGSVDSTRRVSTECADMWCDNRIEGRSYFRIDIDHPNGITWSMALCEECRKAWEQGEDSIGPLPLGRSQ